RNARLLAKFLVAVAPECRAGRGHVGCVCSLGERRDGDQRDQRESGDEFPHDTSPWYGTLSKPTEFVSKLALSHMGLKESFDNREKTECLHCQILRMAVEDCAVPRAPIRSPQLLAARDPKCSWRRGSWFGAAAVGSGGDDHRVEPTGPLTIGSLTDFLRRTASRRSDWVRMKSINARNGPGTWRRLG